MKHELEQNEANDRFKLKTAPAFSLYWSRYMPNNYYLTDLDLVHCDKNTIFELKHLNEPKAGNYNLFKFLNDKIQVKYVILDTKTYCKYNIDDLSVLGVGRNAKAEFIGEPINKGNIDTPFKNQLKQCGYVPHLGYSIKSGVVKPLYILDIVDEDYRILTKGSLNLQTQACLHVGTMLGIPVYKVTDFNSNMRNLELTDICCKVDGIEYTKDKFLGLMASLRN